MKFRAEERLKTISLVFEINLKLIRNGPCLNVLEFFLDGDGTVLRYHWHFVSHTFFFSIVYFCHVCWTNPIICSAF